MSEKKSAVSKIVAGYLLQHHPDSAVPSEVLDDAFVLDENGRLGVRATAAGNSFGEFLQDPWTIQVAGGIALYFITKCFDLGLKKWKAWRERPTEEIEAEVLGPNAPAEEQRITIVRREVIEYVKTVHVETIEQVVQSGADDAE